MSDFPPLVSVVIPSYNSESYIRETLDSILAQTFRDFEILVVDDGSTDHTRDLVSAYGAPVRLITQQNAGVCAARNHGIQQARGQYICLVDHDDYWFPHKLSGQLEQLQTHPEVGVVFSWFHYWEPDSDGHFPTPSSIDLSHYPDGVSEKYSGWIYHQFLLDCWMQTSTATFRREVFDRCGTFDESLPYSEDWDLWIRISREYPFLMLERPDTLYRQHPQQGNRAVRPIDYRTRLLSHSVAKWGLHSPDGRGLPKRVFNRQLSKYHADYGRHQLQAGHVVHALQAFWKAWKRSPAHWKCGAYMVAALVGWRPR
ncbi:MAG: glycosyltransferase [Pseudomonadota bacterium]